MCRAVRSATIRISGSQHTSRTCRLDKLRGLCSFTLRLREPGGEDVDTGPVSVRLPFVSGLLAPATDTGQVFVWKDDSGQVRVLVTGRRRLVAATDFHIVADDQRPFFAFKPGLALSQGNPDDVVYLSTQPVSAEKRLLINAIIGGQHTGLATYLVATGQLVAKPHPVWTVAAEFPLRLSGAAPTGASGDVTVLLENFRAGRNRWPRLADPNVPTEPNRDTPVPSVEHRMRVQGGTVGTRDPEGSRFLEGGYEHVRLILRIAEVYGARFAPGFTTLDWGVGCGRIARHIPPALQPGFAGIDVDPVNIEWCGQNIPFGRFEAVHPYSRTGFDDASFDLIYSHSVLTHLSEQDQFLWLAELGRIARGLLILSVHGPFSAQTAPWSRVPDQLWAWLLRGYRSSGAENPDIRDVTPAGYYRDVAHTPAYILAHWTRFLDVIDIIPGGFGNLHDAVVCRPRAAAGR